MMLLHRRKAHAAISKNNGRHTMPARGSQQRIPHRLPVVVRMQVNPARCNQQTSGVDVAPGGSLLASDRSDHASCDCNVPAKSSLAGAIDDGPSPNDDVVHANLPSPATLVPAACIKRLSHS